MINNPSEFCFVFSFFMKMCIQSISKQYFQSDDLCIFQVFNFIQHL